MAAQVAGVFVEDLRQQILKSKILVVGAGGIGCEILKNLVLSGFPEIEIIDLDTIDVSNLNRQFLFHKEHVGKSKAEVARQSALSFNPNVNIIAHHDSIISPNYGISYFKKFNLVLNALDNRQARNHVNRMCLTADIPLIESGTAGYNGQVELIKKGLTQCYECTPKEGEKSYPQCTIRNTPSELIHCIVWAKYLFNQLFGEVVDDEDVSPDATDPENMGDAGVNALSSKATESGNVQRINTRQWAQSSQYDPKKLFNKFFYDDIKYLLSMSNLWKSRTPPQPVKWEDLNENLNSSFLLDDQKVWSLSECALAFSHTLNALKQEYSKLPENDHLVWDKDNKMAMNFVVASANIRATIFKIPTKSRFEIKSMAGRIIPAIATTNAITAGIVVMHAFKALQGQYDKCKSVYMRLRLNARNQLFVPDKFLNLPSPHCIVCSPKHEVTLKIDTKKMTLKEFKEDVLNKALYISCPDVMTLQGNIIISSEEGETDDNYSKKLNEISVTDGTVLSADDFLQEYQIKIIVLHKDAKRDEPLFEICKMVTENKHVNENKSKNGVDEHKENTVECEEHQAKKRKIEVKSSTECKTDDDNEDDFIIIEDSTKNIEIADMSSCSTKHKSDPGEGPSTSKRSKVKKIDEDDDLIILDD